MKRVLDAPPPVIDNARVLEYAILDATVSYSGHSRLFVNGKELGPVPCLVIGAALKTNETFLFHCKRNWNSLGVAAYKSISEAKQKAERIYPGIGTRWVQIHVSEKKVTKYLDDLWRRMQCTICGKKPDEILQLVEKNGIKVCDSCIIELGQMLQSDDQHRDKRSHS